MAQESKTVWVVVDDGGNIEVYSTVRQAIHSVDGDGTYNFEKLGELHEQFHIQSGNRFATIYKRVVKPELSFVEVLIDEFGTLTGQDLDIAVTFSPDQFRGGFKTGIINTIPVNDRPHVIEVLRLVRKLAQRQK